MWCISIVFNTVSMIRSGAAFELHNKLLKKFEIYAECIFTPKLKWQQKHRVVTSELVDVNYSNCKLKVINKTKSADRLKKKNAICQ